MAKFLSYHLYLGQADLVLSVDNVHFVFVTVVAASYVDPINYSGKDTLNYEPPFFGLKCKSYSCTVTIITYARSSIY